MRDAMKPGRELDALVAEKVMGWVRPAMDSPYIVDDPIHGKLAYLSGEIPHYSADIAAAWEIIEKLRGGYHVTLESFGSHWRCDISVITASVASGTKGNGQGRADTAPMAICLAALKAKGVTIP